MPKMIEYNKLLNGTPDDIIEQLTGANHPKEVELAAAIANLARRVKQLEAPNMLVADNVTLVPQPPVADEHSDSEDHGA